MFLCAKELVRASESSFNIHVSSYTYLPNKPVLMVIPGLAIPCHCQWSLGASEAAARDWRFCQVSEHSKSSAAISTISSVVWRQKRSAPSTATPSRSMCRTFGQRRGPLKLLELVCFCPALQGIERDYFSFSYFTYNIVWETRAAIISLLLLVMLVLTCQQLRKPGTSPRRTSRIHAFSGTSGWKIRACRRRSQRWSFGTSSRAKWTSQPRSFSQTLHHCHCSRGSSHEGRCRRCLIKFILVFMLRIRSMRCCNRCSNSG